MKFTEILKLAKGLVLTLICSFLIQTASEAMEEGYKFDAARVKAVANQYIAFLQDAATADSIEKEVPKLFTHDFKKIIHREVKCSSSEELVGQLNRVRQDVGIWTIDLDSVSVEVFLESRGFDIQFNWVSPKEGEFVTLARIYLDEDYMIYLLDEVFNRVIAPIKK